MTGLKGREFHNAAKQMAAVSDMSQAILYFYEAIERMKIRRSCVLIDDCQSWFAAVDAVNEAKNSPIWGRKGRIATALAVERQKVPPVLHLPQLRVYTGERSIDHRSLETLYCVNPETCEIFVDARALLSTRGRRRLAEQFGAFTSTVVMQVTNVDDKLMRKLIDAL